MRRLPAHACISRSRGGSSYCERAAAALSPLSSGGRSAAPAAVRCSGDAGERADTRKSIKTCETASCREGGRLCSAHVHFVFYQLTRRKASSTGRAGRAPPARRAARRPTPGRRRHPRHAPHSALTASSAAMACGHLCTLAATARPVRRAPRSAPSLSQARRVPSGSTGE